MLELKNIEKQYADKLLFSNVNLSIYDGERVGIVGNNGSGKSTLIKIIAGDEETDKGSVYKSSSAIGYLKQITSYSTEDFYKISLDPVFVKEFLELKKKLNITDNIEFTPKRLKTLSGGEKTKLMLAHILSFNPDTLLLDEPTNHLDLNNKIFMEKILSKFQGALILVSHDKALRENVCNSELVFENKTVKKIV